MTNAEVVQGRFTSGGKLNDDDIQTLVDEIENLKKALKVVRKSESLEHAKRVSRQALNGEKVL